MLSCHVVDFSGDHEVIAQGKPCGCDFSLYCGNPNEEPISNRSYFSGSNKCAKVSLVPSLPREQIGSLVYVVTCVM